MYYVPPKRPKKVALFIRSDPEYVLDLPAADQEELLREYCRSNGYRMVRTVRVRCSSVEALDVLRFLVRTLPEGVDTLLAAHFYCFTRQLPELAALCLVFQCRKTWVYSLDVVGPLYKQLCVIKPEDFELADQRYEEIVRNENGATS